MQRVAAALLLFSWFPSSLSGWTAAVRYSLCFSILCCSYLFTLRQFWWCVTVATTFLQLRAANMLKSWNSTWTTTRNPRGVKRLLHALHHLEKHVCRILSPTLASLYPAFWPYSQTERSSKSKGDGLAVLANSWWSHSDPFIELLAYHDRHETLIQKLTKYFFFWNTRSSTTGLWLSLTQCDVPFAPNMNI